MSQIQNDDREKMINNWIDRAKVVTEHNYQLFQELFDIRLEKDGQFVGYFDASKEAIRYAERRLGIS